MVYYPLEPDSHDRPAGKARMVCKKVAYEALNIEKSHHSSRSARPCHRRFPASVSRINNPGESQTNGASTNVDTSAETGENNI